MTTTTQITQMRQRRRAALRRNPIRKIGQGCGFALGILIALGAFFASLACSSLVQDIPSIEALPTLLQPPDGTLLEPTRFYDRTGEHVIAVLQNSFSTEADYLFLESEFTAAAHSEHRDLRHARLRRSCLLAARWIHFRRFVSRRPANTRPEFGIRIPAAGRTGRMAEVAAKNACWRSSLRAVSAATRCLNGT